MVRTFGRWRVFAALAVILMLVLAGLQVGPGFAQEGDEATPVADGPTSPETTEASPTPELPTIPPETTQFAGDWPVPQGDLAGTRNAVNSSINAGNLSELDVAWTFDLTAAGFFGTVTANPIVAGETVYIQDMQSNIFALNRADGSLKWQADYNVGSIGPNGVAVGYGHVYAGLSDTGEVVGLNAESGEEVWRQKIGSPPGEGIDMAPIVYDGFVWISTVPGTGVGPTFYENGDRGVLYVLDAMTGEVAWWFDTTDGGFGVPAAAGGGGLWYPPSFDEQGNVYFGVGNPAPWPLNAECPNGSCRPGDNLYTSAMVSLDGETGAVRWHYQDRPHDLLDLDFQHTPALATIGINGTDTKVAIGAGKTGNVVAVNADTGEVLWKTPVGIHQNDENADLPQEPIEVYPGTYGGVESPIAYANGTVFVTYLDMPQYQGATGPDPDRSANFAEATGGLVAINAADGTVKWETKLPTLVVGAATVANDVVFTAGLDGFFRGFDVNTGQELWSYEADLGINAPPAIAGDTIFVAAGFVKLPQVGSTATPAAETGEPAVAKLVALRLGGAGAVTTTPEPTIAPTDATVTPDPAATEAGSPVAGGEAGVSVEMIDIAFSPKEITIAANTDVVIDLSNNGAAVHNFVIDELNVHSGDYSPGQTGTVTINAAPGDYQFYCSIPGHKQAGMVGTLHVQ